MAIRLWRRDHAHRLLTPLVALVAACSTATTIRELPTTVDLRIGHRVTIAETSQTLEFTEVLTDSRCPLGVFCIWAGDFQAAINVSGPGDGPTRHVVLDWMKPDSSSGLILSIDGIQPPRRIAQTIDPRSYVISLHIARP